MKNNLILLVKVIGASFLFIVAAMLVSWFFFDVTSFEGREFIVSIEGNRDLEIGSEGTISVTITSQRKFSIEWKNFKYTAQQEANGVYEFHIDSAYPGTYQYYGSRAEVRVIAHQDTGPVTMKITQNVLHMYLLIIAVLISFVALSISFRLNRRLNRLMRRSITQINP